MRRGRRSGGLLGVLATIAVAEHRRRQRARREAMRPHAERERAKLARSRAEIIDELTRLDGECCHACGASFGPHGCHVDHTLPVARGGLTEMANLALLCAGCNLAKGAKSPRQWRRRPCCERHAWAWAAKS